LQRKAQGWKHYQLGKVSKKVAAEEKIRNRLGGRDLEKGGHISGEGSCRHQRKKKGEGSSTKKTGAPFHNDQKGEQVPKKPYRRQKRKREKEGATEAGLKSVDGGFSASEGLRHGYQKKIQKGEKKATHNTNGKGDLRRESVKKSDMGKSTVGKGDLRNLRSTDRGDQRGK